MRNLTGASNTDQNLLLCSLSASERERLLADLQPVTFPLGSVVYEAGERICNCYFPTTSVLSLLYTMQNGSTAEVGLVGNEGVSNVAAFLGGESSCSRIVAAVAGNALKMPTTRLREEFARCGSLQRLLLRYTQAFLTQVSQTAVCNRLHSMEERLCRWLLLCQDRANGSELHMTQELIASMLGGRRESVTVAAGHLQDAGLIHYCRGHIVILDRDGLESAACECYRAVEDEVGRSFGRERRPHFSRRVRVSEEPVEQRS